MHVPIKHNSNMAMRRRGFRGDREHPEMDPAIIDRWQVRFQRVTRNKQLACTLSFAKHEERVLQYGYSLRSLSRVKRSEKLDPYMLSGYQ